MFFYLIFIGALAAIDAIGNVTVTKDKRQIDQPTHSFVPSNHQIGGQHQYAASGEQITATPQNYYRYVQNLLQHQQQQPQQYQQDSPKEIPSPQNEHRHHAQPIKPAQYVYYNEPPAQHNQHQLEPKVISEEEYLELVRQQNGENVNRTATTKHRANKASQYKAQKDYQQTYIPNEQPQSYLKSYVNPLGEFSLEKELAQLEKSNKAIYNENAEKDTEQSLKRERFQFKPSHQFVEYHNQQDQFLPPEYSHLSAIRPVSQKLISNPYERDESVAEKANNNPPEYQLRFVSPTENAAKFYQAAIKSGPKNTFVPFPKPLDETDSAVHANANIAKKHSQLIYQKQHTPSPTSSSAQHSPPNKKQSQKIPSEKFSQYQPNKAQSQSSIFVSQSTGIQQKPQEENEQQLQEIQQQQQQQIQQEQLYHHHHQHQQPPHHQPQTQNNPRLPITNPNRPLTQEEFQALIDAGYKVQAIPIPVPVPVSAEEFAQHQQQQNQQHQQHQYQPQQQTQQHPYHLQQSGNPTRPSSIRPQPSNKHYIRYQPQPTEGVLTSYLRPFLEQYNNLMGGKI